MRLVQASALSLGRPAGTQPRKASPAFSCSQLVPGSVVRAPLRTDDRRLRSHARLIAATSIGSPLPGRSCSLSRRLVPWHSDPSQGARLRAALHALLQGQPRRHCRFRPPGSLTCRRDGESRAATLRQWPGERRSSQHLPRGLLCT